MGRKRGLSYQPYNLLGGLGGSRESWNPKEWKWDATRFVAQQVDETAMNLDENAQNMDENHVDAGEDDGSLCLKLGSGLGCSSFSDEPLRKKVARLPGGSGSGTHPTCQVDSCMVDLSIAKEYHRRHKVCESHSKAAQALVGKQMQRFCQQCSRFHVLSEFDEGKRSCRRRLSGHNRRRRKTQPEDGASQLASSGGTENILNRGLDLVNLLTTLTHAQENQYTAIGDPVSVPNNEQLIQFISKINTFAPTAERTTKMQSSNISSKDVGKTSPEHQSGSSNQSTLKLLDTVPHALQVSSPVASRNLPQKSPLSNDNEKPKSADICQQYPFLSRECSTLEMSFINGERNSNSCISPEDLNSKVHDTQVNLPLQLFFSHPENNNSPMKIADSSKYLSSDSSSQNEDKTPSSSPGVQLFPVKTSTHSMNHKNIPLESNAKVSAKRKSSSTMPFDLFGGDFQISPNHVGYASTGSEYSPSSSTCGDQSITRKISFKLFGKVPSHLPATLRPEILAWLSYSPTQIESYIRPGCVVLNIYVSMSYAAWEELDRNLLEHASRLLQCANVDIWKDGRFLFQTGKQLVSHNNGKFRLCKSWITPKTPQLISVSPLAIVGDCDTCVHLTGRNLNVGTKIHYTFMGGYVTKELSDATVNDFTFDGTRLCRCEIHIAAPSGTGRYFIEVENGFKGNSFPIIVADSNICKELRQLEFELKAHPKQSESTFEEHVTGLLMPKAEVLNFLNELGWLFQMKIDSSNTLDYSTDRFKFLLTFSVEKDFSVLVKKLLDTLIEQTRGGEGIPAEVSEMVSAVQLLHRAVKRRCRNMVDMLINYFSIVNYESKPSKIYIFPPNTAGPGGLTPLHIAACTSGSEDMIDALTNDPLELGLSSWNTQLDANGLSPCAYATSRNNLSYNKLVAQKNSDRRNNQISVSVDENGTMEHKLVYPSHSASHQVKHKAASCPQCAIVAARCNQRRLAGSHGMVARPFLLSLLAIAAICVCVCLYFRGSPYTRMDSPFTWENLQYGTI